MAQEPVAGLMAIGRRLLRTGCAVEELGDRDVLLLGQVAEIGEHNIHTLHTILNGPLTYGRLRGIGRTIANIPCDVLLYFSLDVRLCTYIKECYERCRAQSREDSITMRGLHEAVMNLYFVVGTLSKAGEYARIGGYARDRELLRALSWLCYGSRHKDDFCQVICFPLILSVVGNMEASLRLYDVIDPSLLNDLLACEGEACTQGNFFLLCATVAKLGYDLMCCDIGSSHLNHCLVGSNAILGDRQLLSSHHLGALLGYYFSVVNEAFYAFYLGLVAAKHTHDSSPEVFRSDVVDTIARYTLDRRFHILPSVMTLDEILHFRGFLTGAYTGHNAIVTAAQVNFTRISISFSFNLIRALITGSFGYVHYLHLIKARVLRFFFMLVSSYFSHDILTIATLVYAGLPISNLTTDTRLTPNYTVDKKLKSVSNGMRSNLFNVLYRFLDKCLRVHFPLAYLLSPEEHKIMGFETPPNYTIWGCGAHPLTGKGLLTTLIDLYIYLPLQDGSRGFLALFLGCAIKGASPRERTFFIRYKLFEYIKEMFMENDRSLLFLNVEYQREIINNFDLLAYILLDNPTIIHQLDLDKRFTRFLLNSLTSSVVQTTVAIRSIIYMTIKTIAQYAPERVLQRLFGEESSFSLPRVLGECRSPFLGSFWGHWLDFLSLIFTFRFENLEANSICIINTALMLLHITYRTGRYTLRELLERTFLYPLLHVHLNFDVLTRDLDKAPIVETIERQKGIRLTRRHLEAHLRNYCRTYIDPVLAHLSAPQKEASYARLKRMRSPLDAPMEMTNGQRYPIQFPWTHPGQYIARAILLSLHSRASGQMDLDLLEEALLEDYTYDHLQADTLCPDYLGLYRFCSFWEHVFSVRGRDLNHLQYTYAMNITELRRFCGLLRTEVDGFLADVLGPVAFARIRSTEKPLQPFLFGFEISGNERYSD
ncbi:hypothetical protein GMRT_13151 [Giardia muris]|uniref:Uncharacterized protein n=1 Tax=Giardia muris TaxID=5742 RepID=A0A4Z1T2M4_GIAMU|nr:hypothetical protein GMRT_13151 [Giardia muris]|eukprot:TNJ26671.1 hypothetical protein GMRT_13151 [Giardia muris]